MFNSPEHENNYICFETPISSCLQTVPVAVVNHFKLNCYYIYTICSNTENSEFWPQSVFTYFVRSSQQSAILSLHNLDITLVFGGFLMPEGESKKKLIFFPARGQ